MKKTILLSLFLSLSLMTQAQVKKSTKTATQKTVANTATVVKKSSNKASTKKWDVGLNVDGEFNSQTANNSSTNFGINAMGGYHITPEILAGARLGASFHKVATEIYVGVFGRYYYQDFFGGVGINHGSFSTKTNSPFGTISTTVSRDYATVEGGYRIKTTENITIETSLNYNYTISPVAGDSWVGVKVGAVYSF